jgi:hypothetical protein
VALFVIPTLNACWLGRTIYVSVVLDTQETERRVQVRMLFKAL